MAKFTKKNVDATELIDPVFYAAANCNRAIEKYGKENVINATIGTLYDEDNNLVALKTVYGTYDSIDPKEKAAYAKSFAGNPDFRRQAYKWVTQGSNVNLCHGVCATPGGTGAISATFSSILDNGDTIVLPNIAWGSYWTMSQTNNFKTTEYRMFDGDSFNIKSFKETCDKVMEKQGKVLALINDPCHNPTGYSMTNDEWSQVIDVVNELSEKGPFVLVDDIAYIDFSYDLENSRKYMDNFNKLGKNALIVVCFSTSKTLTSYGLRCGAAVAMAREEESVKEFLSLCEKTARSVWSCIPNAAMENFVKVTTEKHDEFMAEKQYYVDLVKQRSDIFKKEADECGLPYYPYKEGFFVTVRLPDNETCEKYQQALFDANIFGVRCDKGIRMAVCSLPIRHTMGLAAKMKKILDETMQKA